MNLSSNRFGCGRPSSVDDIFHYEMNYYVFSIIKILINI